MTIDFAVPAFGVILESVSDNVIRSQISFDIWWAQEGEEERPIHLAAMNHYPDYFRFDALAHMSTTVTGTYRLYDRRPDVRSLRMLIEASKSTPGVSPATTAEAQGVFDTADVHFEKLKILRNKAFGHTDLVLSWDAAFEMAEITPLELRSMLVAALKVVNVFETELSLVRSEFYDFPVVELRKLLAFLAQVRESEG